jgi:signal peptidase II
VAAARWFLFAGAVLVADQFTKWAAQQFLEIGHPVTVIPGFFALRLAHNPGAAFSLLADAGGWQRAFFIALGLVVSAGIAWWMWRLADRERWTSLGLALILGGALGNVIDRILHGHVIDFLDFHYRQWHWPTFNLADSAITVGAAVLIAAELFSSHGKRRAARSGGRGPL